MILVFGFKRIKDCLIKLRCSQRNIIVVNKQIKPLVDYKLRRYDRIVNETTIHQTPNDVD